MIKLNAPNDCIISETHVTVEKKKHKAALQFATNIHHQFDKLKIKKGVAHERCPCCGQLLKNPFTQEWLGKQCGMSKATIVHYFQGNRLPTFPVVARIAVALECEFLDLLCGIDASMFQLPQYQKDA